MELIPAIDLIDGKCVRLYQGGYSLETVFHDDPVEVALQWQDLGAGRIHIVDLDGARSGNPDNLRVVERIVSSVNVPIQMGGGVRSLDAARRIIEAGVQRVMLGTVAVRNPEIVRVACAELGSDAVVVAVDSKDGQVAVSGWTSASEMRATDLIRNMMDAGVHTFLCTDISSDGTLYGPDYDLMRDLVTVAGNGVIAAGGIASIEHLQFLADVGVGGAVIGKALYTGGINLPQALATVARISANRSNPVTDAHISTSGKPGKAGESIRVTVSGIGPTDAILSESFGRQGKPGPVEVSHLSGLVKGCIVSVQIGTPGEGGEGGNPDPNLVDADESTSFAHRGGAGGGRENTPLIEAFADYAKSKEGALDAPLYFSEPGTHTFIWQHDTSTATLVMISPGGGGGGGMGESSPGEDGEGGLNGAVFVFPTYLPAQRPQS